MLIISTTEYYISASINLKALIDILPSLPSLLTPKMLTIRN